MYEYMYVDNFYIKKYKFYYSYRSNNIITNQEFITKKFFVIKEDYTDFFTYRCITLNKRIKHEQLYNQLYNQL